MTRSLSASLLSMFRSNTSTRAMLLKLEPANSHWPTLYMTDHDQDLVRDLGDGNGDVKFLAKHSFQQTKNETSLLGGGPQKLNVSGPLSLDGLTAENMRAGGYDGAEWILAFADWTDADAGVTVRSFGKLGAAKWRDYDFELELAGTERELELTDICAVMGPACDNELGDGGCRVQLDVPEWEAGLSVSARPDKDASAPGSGANIVKPTSGGTLWFKALNDGTTDSSPGVEPSWPSTEGATVDDNDVTWEAVKALRVDATVTAVSDNDDFDVSGASIDQHHFRMGQAEWLTGNNAGLITEIAEDDGSGGIRLRFAMYRAVQVGDTVRLTAGCPGRRVQDCVQRFNNVYHYVGSELAPDKGLLSKLPKRRRDGVG